MKRELPAELFAPDGVWLLAAAPLGDTVPALVRQVVQSGDVDSAYVPAFTSLEAARAGIAWLSPTDPDELVPFSVGDLARFKALLSGMTLKGHAFLLLNPVGDHNGERVSVRDLVKAIQARLLAALG
ncbi:hypothetical protein [Gemmata sp.]|uniref:hypothetical protein n=1 Tax=Gemmata sp. TaxID=1914242 RepID=UPI003F70420D